MEYPRGSLRSPAISAMPRDLRRLPRHPLTNVAYLTINDGNGGILHDISENGLSLQSVTPLHVHQRVLLRFQLPGPKVSVDAQARVCWATQSGQAGVEFIDLPSHTSQTLKDWLLGRLFARADHLAGSGAIFGNGEFDPSLLVSGKARDPITLLAEVGQIPAKIEDPRQSSLDLPWIPFSFSLRALAVIVDGLILFTAVLFFSILTIGMIRTIPRWPWSGLLLVASAALFFGAYWVLFIRRLGFTPGMYLAQIAVREEKPGSLYKEEPQTRFR